MQFYLFFYELYTHVISNICLKRRKFLENYICFGDFTGNQLLGHLESIFPKLHGFYNFKYYFLYYSALFYPLLTIIFIYLVNENKQIHCIFCNTQIVIGKNNGSIYFIFIRLQHPYFLNRSCFQYFFFHFRTISSKT